MLDELAGAMARQGMIKTSPVSYLLGLVKRTKCGEFHPSLGVEISAMRQRRAVEAQTRKEQRLEHQHHQHAAQSDSARQAAATHFAKMANLGIQLNNSLCPSRAYGHDEDVGAPSMRIGSLQRSSAEKDT